MEAEEERSVLQNKETLDSINTEIQLSIIGYIKLRLEGVNVLSAYLSRTHQQPWLRPSHGMEMRLPGSENVLFSCGQDQIFPQEVVSINKSVSSVIFLW